MLVEGKTYTVPPGDQAVLLDAIGRATGLDHPFREHPPPASWWGRDDSPTPEPPDGVAIEVLGGAIDRQTDRVAWVERNTFPPDEDWIDGFVNVWVNLAGKGFARLPRIEGWVYQDPKPQVSVRLAADRSDKVTRLEYVRFFDSSPESLVVVYDWAGTKQLLRLTLSARGLRGVQSHWVGLGNGTCVVLDGEHDWDPSTLWYHRNAYPLDDELVYGLRLPDFTPVTPVLAPRLTAKAEYVWATLDAGAAGGTVRWTEQLSEGQGRQAGRSVELRPPSRSQTGLVDEPSLVWNRLRAALSEGAPPDGPDILIGALTPPFWDPTGPVSPGGRGEVWEVLQGRWWFPAAWYDHLRTHQPDQAEAWLRWLDALAGQDDGGTSTDRGGWDPAWTREEGAARFALAHVRRQASALAAACREGTAMPVLGDFGTWRNPPNLAIAPPGFVRAWRESQAR